MTRSQFALAGACMLGILGMSRAAQADCYVDSNNGKDTNDGKSPSTPVKTQTAIPSGCTTVRYARGSKFNEPVKVINGVTNYTNYTPPGGSANDTLPDFNIANTSAASGSVLIAMQGGITVDGLKLEGAHNTGGSLSSLGTGGGICVFVGNNTTVKNCEVTNCDFGIFFAYGQGTGNNFATNNYVHDVLGEAVDGDAGSDPNAVGGAKGIYVMANNTEVSYNTIVNAANYPQWTGANGSPKGRCDGGATEIAVNAGGTLKNVKIHHNFAFNTCGFFQASTFFQSGTATGKGTFDHSEFSYNVMVDAAWMVLLQVNNTNFTDMHWNNNTVVQHATSIGPTANFGMLMEVWTGPSSGFPAGGQVEPNQIFLTNNLMVLAGVSDTYDFNKSWNLSPDFGVNTNIVMTSNIFLQNTSLNPGFIKLGDGKTVPSPTDFDLSSDTVAIPANGSFATAISQGTPVSGLTLDFLNRVVPSASGKTDIGAFQYDSVVSDAGAPRPAIVDAGGASSSSSSGGASTTSSSGAATSSSGGMSAGSSGGGGGGGTSAQSGCNCRVAGGSADGFGEGGRSGFWHASLGLLSLSLVAVSRRRRRARASPSGAYRT